MAAVDESEEELHGKSIHVGHGQYAHQVASWLDVGRQALEYVVEVAPQSAVGQHHAL